MRRAITAAFVLSLFTAPALAVDLLSPGDFILGIDHEQDAFTSNHPDGEPPEELLSGDNGKYLNFSKENSGIIVTPGAASVVQSFVITTAGDASPRDPGSYELYGTNDAITSLDGSTGQAEDWSLISSGGLSLTNDRNTAQTPVGFANADSYTSYRLLFPTLKDSGGANSMQINELQFYPNNDGTGAAILTSSDPILAIDTDLTPDGERAPFLIDGDTGTKFLSFAKENSGVVVTPGVGKSVVESLSFNLANDSEGFSARDPMSFEIYGTNGPVLDVEDGSGLESDWTLIDSDDLTYAPEDFGLVGPIAISASTGYTSYKVVFPTLRDAPNANSLQISELQLSGRLVPEPGVLSLALLSGLAMIRRRK